MFNSWNQTLITQQSAGAALANSTSQTSVLNPQALFTLPAGFLVAAGAKLRIYAGGKMSTAASSPGTFTWTVLFGTIAATPNSTFVSGTLATSAVNLTWNLMIDITVQTVGSGSTATVLSRGRFETAALSATTPVLLLPTSGIAATAPGFDSTVSFKIDLQGTWSVGSASNTITCTDYELVSLN